VPDASLFLAEEDLARRDLHAGCRPRGADRGLAGRGSLLPFPDADFNGPAELPDIPTEAWPGSEELVL